MTDERRFMPDPTFVELRRLADVVYSYLGTRDPVEVAEWIREARAIAVAYAAHTQPPTI